MIKESGIVERLAIVTSILEKHGDMVAVAAVKEAATLIAELQDKVDRLTERCSAHEGQVKWGSETIERLQSSIAELQAERDSFRFMADKNYANWSAATDERDVALERTLAAESSLHRVRETAWQPIETSPKDGTAIILGFWYRGRFAIYQGFYDPAGWMENSQRYFPSHMQGWFSHWMPLPAPPAVADTNADAPGNVGLLGGVSADPSSLNITGLDTGAVKTGVAG